jgi:hypothetical protein
VRSTQQTPATRRRKLLLEGRKEDPPFFEPRTEKQRGRLQRLCK